MITVLAWVAAGLIGGSLTTALDERIPLWLRVLVLIAIIIIVRLAIDAFRGGC